MAWEWLTPVVSGGVGAAGLVFAWFSGRQSRRQTETLAEQNNRHTLRMAEEGNRQALQLEELRNRLATQERRHDRLAEFYVETATAVIRVSDAAREVSDREDDRPAALPQDELLRAAALVELFMPPAVREAFTAWRACVADIEFAASRRAAVEHREEDGVTSAASPHWMWHRRTRDARLREVDARDKLVAAIGAEIRGLTGG